MNTTDTQNEYQQVVVWPSTLLGDASPEDFAKWIETEFNGTRIKDAIEYKVNNTRTDLVFRVSAKDIPKFAVARLSYGMRWLEDVMNNDNCYRPPLGYKRCW